MNKSILLAVGAASALCGISWAQETNSAPEKSVVEKSVLEKMPPPKSPLIARAPEHSSWIIQIAPKGKGPAEAALDPKLPPKYIKQQTWTKSGTLMRCVTEWTDGSKTEGWVSGGAKFQQDPHTGDIQIFSPIANPAVHNFSVGDFERLDWLTIGDYVGVVEHSDQVCYLFRAKTLASAKASYDSIAEVNAPETPTSVFVSVKTHLPVSIINGDGEYHFQFQEAPPGELKMPEAYVSTWKILHHR